MGIPILKIRRSRDRLIFNMRILILVRRHVYIETPSRVPHRSSVLRHVRTASANEIKRYICNVSLIGWDCSNVIWDRPIDFAWWRHQMETFSTLLAVCVGNSPILGEFPAQRPVTRSFDVFFDLRLNKRLSKQSRGWWFETLSCPLWRHSNGQRDSDLPIQSCGWPWTKQLLLCCGNNEFVSALYFSSDKSVQV